MDNLKSVLFVLPADAIGGAETKFFNIISSLCEIERILLTQRAIAGFFSIPGTRTYSFDEFGCMHPMPFSPWKTVRYAKAVAEIARREHPDFIIGIMHTGCFYVSVARDMYHLRTPHIGTIEGNITAYFSHQRRSPTLIERACLWYLLKRPARIVVPSQGVRKDIRDNFGISDRRISVIYNGVDIDSIRQKASEPPYLQKRGEGRLIMTACRLNEQKDFLTLLRAFKTVRESSAAELVIVGDGELKDEILKITSSYELEKYVTVTGFRKNPFPYIREADVFVLSSFYEGFGNVIVEAMALGVPVVATDCPSGPGEIIQDGTNGLLVPVGDHLRMADAIMRMMTDQEKRKECISKGLETADRYRSDIMADNFMKILRDL